MSLPTLSDATIESRASRAGSSPTHPSSPWRSTPLWWPLLQLTALSFHIPLAVLSGPQQAMVGVGSAVWVGIGVTAAAVTAYVVLLLVSRSGWRALGWVSVGVMFFWHWEGPGAVGAVPGWVISLALLALCVAGVTRVAESRRFRIAVLAVSVTISGTLLLMSLQARLTTPPTEIDTHRDVATPMMSSTPDIVLVVLDAYARADVLDQVYGYDNTDFIESLEGRGFVVPDSANANYASTHYSLASMLEMEYVADPGSPISNSDLDLLTDSISGSNEFVGILKENGYTYVHGDTDHWLNTCGPAVDRCEPGPVIDVTGDALLGGSAAGPFLYRDSGDPTTSLNLRRIEQLENWEEFNEPGEGPTFTFLHLVLPHPPLHLDTTCQPHPSDLLDGRNVTRGEFSPEQLEQRRAAYVAQVECANQTVGRFLAQVSPDATVIITADHGPDSFLPMTSETEASPEQAWERFATFTAIRFPEQCEGPDEDHQLVNTFRLLIGCLTGSPMEMLDNHYFVAAYAGTVEELKDPDLAAESLPTEAKESEE